MTTKGPLRVGRLTIGQGRPAIIVSLTGATAEATVDQAKAVAARADVDIAEFRIDHLTDALDPAVAAALAPRLVAALGGKPLLATFRSKREGGEKAVDPATYAAIYAGLLHAGGVDLLDLELAMLEHKAVAGLHADARRRGVPAMLSHHDFGGTPSVEQMVAILEREAAAGADICKLAVMPKTPADVVRLLDATVRMRARHPERLLLTMSMGGLGAVSRVAGEVFGSAMTFGKIEGASAPGQLDAGEMKAAMTMLGDALG